MILPKVNLNIERWKWNADYGVYVSNMGNFKRSDKKDLPKKIWNGYHSVYTCCGWRPAHRLVALTWLPIPDAEMQKALTKTDGSLMSVEEALNTGIISEECLEAIGYRIPTEDKYSMYPMKIVGFLPSSEEIIMLPKEITLITGSDKYHCFYQYNIKNFLNCWKLLTSNVEDNQQPSPMWEGSTTIKRII